MENKPHPPVMPHPGRQRGVIAIMHALTMIVLLGFCALSLDLARVYNRKAELQSMADAAVLAAARELDGTSAGVTRAITRARQIAEGYRFAYNQSAVSWSDAAIAFGRTRNGGWTDASGASATPDGMFFVRVDTRNLDEAVATVGGMFMQILNAENTTASVGGTAVAGRSTINVLPMGICAMSALEGAARNNPGPPARVELVQYGFRRGVSYDLMQLNPGGDTPANFVVSPIDPPGTAGHEAHTNPPVVGPFICTGTMSMARVQGAPIRIKETFPLAELFNQFNSRFDQYGSGLCHPNGAPPDSNVKQYPFTSIPWMTNAPGAPEGQTASTSTIAGARRETVADPVPAPATNTAPMYGPLWSFARAVPFSAYTPGVKEPANGYASFATSDWAILYKPGAPAANGSYPPSAPYWPTAGANFQAPSGGNGTGVRFRRVLNVPLLSCPTASATSATVLAIGRFFMTVPATSTSVSAEFAGLASEQALGGPVELYP